jgi:toxin ParE1/3/4
MILPIEFSQKALTDLEEISAFLHATGSRNAVRFIDDLDAAVASLAEYPERFSVVPEFTGVGLRRCVCRAYVIFYIVRIDTVYIVRVMHGSRDVASDLADEL